MHEKIHSQYSTLLLHLLNRLLNRLLNLERKHGNPNHVIEDQRFYNHFGPVSSLFFLRGMERMPGVCKELSTLLRKVFLALADMTTAREANRDANHHHPRSCSHLCLFFRFLP